MKAIRIVALALLLVITKSIAQQPLTPLTAGELIFDTTGLQSGDSMIVTISAQSPYTTWCLSYNDANAPRLPTTSFSYCIRRQVVPGDIAFQAPDDYVVFSDTTLNIAWGIYDIHIQIKRYNPSGQDNKYFTLDLRDANWIHGGYTQNYVQDTRIIYHYTTVPYVTHDDGNGGHSGTISNESSHTIWDWYDFAQNQTDLFVPVTATNSGISGGQIKMDGAYYDVPNTLNWGWTQTKSIEAKTPQFDNNAIPWAFTQWSDNITTQSRNVTIDDEHSSYPFTAQFANSNHSTSDSATASNNGRSIIRDSDGRYHLVFESGNEIIYRRSNVGATSWESSVRLSSLNGNNKCPSITATNNKQFVVWQRYTGYSGGQYRYDTYFAKNTGSGWSTSTIANLSSLGFSSRTDPLPVISYHSTPRLVVCVRTSDGIKYCTTDNEGSTWSSASILPSSGSGDKNASLSDSTTIPCTTIYAAYDDGSAVYYNTYNGSWGSEVNVSSGSGTTNNCYPSAAVDGSGGRLIAWQGYSNILEMNVIIHKRNSEAFVTFAYSGDGGNYPSITGLAGSHRAIVCTSDGATDLNRSVYDGSSWDNQNSIDSNVYWPSLSAGTTYAKYVFAKGTDPYEISVYSSSLSKENSQENPFHRAVVFQSSDTKSLLWLELGKMELVGGMMENTIISPIDLKNQDISAVADASVLRYMDSEIFTIPRTADSLKWFERIYCSGGQNLFISSAKAMTVTLKLVDQQNSKSLCILGTWPVAIESGEQRIGGCFTKNISAFRGKVVRIITEIAELPVVQKEVSAGVVDLYLGNTKTSIHKGAEFQEARVPFQFDISVAYPNPFNSLTLFRYSLLEQKEAVIEIYNSLGQKIRTLVKELMSSGQHEARWDGRNDSGIMVSSGVYLCRFQCGEYIKTQKVVLLQ